MRQDRRTFLCNAALAGGAITLRGFVSSGQSRPGDGASRENTEAMAVTDADQVRREFQSPPKKYRPIVRWWWPGNDVTPAELRREIDALDKAGFGGAEIQAFFKGLSPTNFSQAELERINRYASPSFFQNVAVAAGEAQRHGMFIDYTFGSGWPFGGGYAITPELASIDLRSTHLSVTGPAKLRERVQIPAVTDGDPLHGADILKGLPEGWAERLKKRTKVEAVVAVRGEKPEWNSHRPQGTVLKPGRLEQGTSIDLTSQLQPDGTLVWNVPPGTWQLFVFCSLPTVQRVNGGAGNGPQLVMDHMSVAAFQAHAKRVGDKAVPYLRQYFGNGLRAVFCDSLEVGANLYWSDDFLAEFRRRRGYDLLPYLPILKVRSYGEPFGNFVDVPTFEIPDVGPQVRHDYRQTLSDIMIERFYEQFNQWAHDHNLLSRTQAHGAPADVLRIYGEADISETETLYDQGGYDFLKMAASSTHVYGRSIVGSESFVWPGALYETTPEKMKIAADELLTAGVNAIVYHGFAYLIPSLPHPGWHPFSGINNSGNYSSQLNELNPFWPYLAQLNGYITRLQYISQVGKSVAAVALYRNDLAHGAEEQPPVPKLNQALLDAGYNYDHINVHSLLNSSVQNGVLVTRGGAHYLALVFPAIDAIDADLTGKLHEFANDGLPIFFSSAIPARATGFHDNAHNTQRVKATAHDLHASQNVHVSASNGELVSALQHAVNPNIRFHGNPFPFIQKRIGKANAFLLRNQSDTMQQLSAELEADGEPELWDSWTGRTTAVAGHRRNGNWVKVDFDMQPLSSALIVFDPDAAASPATASAAAGRLKRSEPIGANGWKLIATGAGPSGQITAIRRNLPQLIDWVLDNNLRGFSGRGVYSTTFTIPSADADSRLMLDLGNVKDVAEVTINGKHAVTLLLRPYQADITNFVRPGTNTLEIAVTNTLFNSMALREPRVFRPGATENPCGLMSSGLIGPVQIKVME